MRLLPACPTAAMRQLPTACRCRLRRPWGSTRPRLRQRCSRPGSGTSSKPSRSSCRWALGLCHAVPCRAVQCSAVPACQLRLPGAGGISRSTPAWALLMLAGVRAGRPVVGSATAAGQPGSQAGPLPPPLTTAGAGGAAQERAAGGGLWGPRHAARADRHHPGQPAAAHHQRARALRGHRQQPRPRVRGERRALHRTHASESRGRGGGVKGSPWQAKRTASSSGLGALGLRHPSRKLTPGPPHSCCWRARLGVAGVAAGQCPKPYPPAEHSQEESID
jgi:hypothetical protein